MKKNNGNQEQSPQQILKRIEKQSSEEKKKTVLQILSRKNTAKPQNIFKPQIIKYKISENWSYVLRQINNPLYQKTAMITCFLIFSTFIAWKIEQKYDKMRKVATRTKTYKQMQVQQQNQYINRFLADKQFKAVPIDNQVQFNPNYKYQEEEGMVMDTKQYLLEAIAKEYKQGLPVDPQMESELRNKGLI